MKLARYKRYLKLAERNRHGHFGGWLEGMPYRVLPPDHIGPYQGIDRGPYQGIDRKASRVQWPDKHVTLGGGLFHYVDSLLYLSQMISGVRLQDTITKVDPV